jgi:non-ribosomal peptide synthetase component F
VRLPAETAPTSAVEPRVGEARVELPIAALEGLASRFDVSPAAVLLAAWQIVLWRLVGRRRFALGVAQEGRRPEDRDAAHALGA